MTGYGEDFRRISEINTINRTGPDGGGSGAMYQNNRRKREAKGFADILDNEKKEAHERSDIMISSTGYGPKGQPSMVMIKMKDYTYQA
jgi:hypothetical protein